MNYKNFRSSSIKVIKKNSQLFIGFTVALLLVSLINISSASHRNNVQRNGGSKNTEKSISADKKDNIATDNSQTTSTAKSNGATNSTPNKTNFTNNPSVPSPQANASQSSTAANAEQQRTMNNCVFSNGPREGSNCPVAVPSSWSYSVICYANGGAASCPPYSQTGWISASYNNGGYYCVFSFRGEGNPTNAQQKTVRVVGYGAVLPDCQTALPGV